MFTNDDIACIEAHGLTAERVEKQIENFRNGFPFLPIVRAAAPSDGITVLSKEQLAAAEALYDEHASEMRIIKFVPASGAATRMFKELFEFVNEGRRGEGIDKLLDNIERFAFFPELAKYITPQSTDEEIVSRIIAGGLGYGSKPKGLVTFHAYADGLRKPVEEHLVEGALYARSGDRVAIHFTVSPEHRSGFEALLGERLGRYEELFGVKFDISFSTQRPSTDTIAVDMDNRPFRTDDGGLLFRPAGHGALIENLDSLDADIIFIKNIDNVTTDRRKGDTVLYKKVLAGELLRLQRRSYELIEALLRGEKSATYSIDVFRRHHDQVEARLRELKNIIIKYYPSGGTNELNGVLFDIFTCEQELASHNAVEDGIFIPAVERLAADGVQSDEKQETLSAREREIIVCVVKGMTNKQIADCLCISAHTVITHRRNIAAKLQIHSAAGLTIYAIVNKLVDLSEIKETIGD